MPDPSLAITDTVAAAPGNTLLRAKSTGLPKDSVANASQLLTVDRELLKGRVGKLAPRLLAQILQGMDLVLGR